MASLNWGITPDEGRAIIAHASGAVVLRDTTGGKPAHRSRLVDVSNRQGKIHIKGANGIWYPLGSIKPENGKAREIVEAMRAKPEHHEHTYTHPQRKETTMPPEHAPRPMMKPVTIQAPTDGAPASVPGSITIAASKIETALRIVDDKRRDVKAAKAEFDAAKAMFDEATKAVDAAESEARRLAVELNKLITVSP